MDINKLTNNSNGKTNEVDGTAGSRRPTDLSQTTSKREISDRVSLNDFNSVLDEKVFAKIELEKLNQASFNRLRDFKIKLQEYESASAKSPEEASRTEIGKLINDPEVLEKIAAKILNK
jgi:hypothetical protein